MASYSTSIVLVLLLVAFAYIPRNGAQYSVVGICYGRKGDNIPPPGEVVGMFKDLGVNRMRLYRADYETLQALRGSGIELIVAMDELQLLATDVNAANGWVRDTIQAYAQDVVFRYIAVGNEVIPTGPSVYVLPAMRNIHNALVSYGLQNQVKVSTAVHTAVLGTSYPPSAGAFSGPSAPFMGPIVKFLEETGAPLLVNAYPYFSFRYSNGGIPLPYALFQSPSPNAVGYQNLFDATVDAFYSALQKCGAAPSVKVVVSETGWPSNGGVAEATVENAQAYNQNLINHVKAGKGTPMTPGMPIEAYIFAMFNENLKTGDLTEQHFGLFYPVDKSPVYTIQF